MNNTDIFKYLDFKDDTIYIVNTLKNKFYVKGKDIHISSEQVLLNNVKKINYPLPTITMTHPIGKWEYQITGLSTETLTLIIFPLCELGHICEFDDPVTWFGMTNRELSNWMSEKYDKVQEEWAKEVEEAANEKKKKVAWCSFCRCWKKSK